MTREEIIKEFSEVTGINEAKKVYKTLAKKLHPDVGGSEEEFKLLNAIYNDFIENKIYFSNDFKIDLDLEKIISQILHFENITIELVGSWIWLSGDTKEIKDKLKELNENNGQTLFEIILEIIKEHEHIEFETQN